MPNATFLVVDDNRTVLEVVSRLVVAAGYRVVPAESAETALALLEHEPVDAAIVDVDLPGMNGVALCRALHAHAASRGRNCAVWLMTGMIRPELSAAAEQAGALGVLAKPFTRAELLACLERMLGPAEHPAIP